MKTNLPGEVVISGQTVFFFCLLGNVCFIRLGRLLHVREVVAVSVGEYHVQHVVASQPVAPPLLNAVVIIIYVYVVPVGFPFETVARNEVVAFPVFNVSEPVAVHGDGCKVVPVGTRGVPFAVEVSFAVPPVPVGLARCQCEAEHYYCGDCRFCEYGLGHACGAFDFCCKFNDFIFDCVSVSCFNLRRPSFCCAYYFLTLQGIDAAAMTGSVRTLNQKHTYLY